MDGRDLPNLICGADYQPKIDELEKRFGRRDELKSAIEHAVVRAVFNEEEYVERFRLPLVNEDLRLLPFNSERSHSNFPTLYILFEVSADKSSVTLVDILEVE